MFDLGLPDKDGIAFLTEIGKTDFTPVIVQIVFAPMVAETHEYQYNADAFEARGSADVKVEAPKKVPMVRTEKAR